MFIQTESTPNPETLKFLPGQTIVEEGTVNYTARDDATNSPLAQALFSNDYVQGVFFGKDFITITKGEGIDWIELKPMVLTTIMEHFVANKPIFSETISNDNSSEDDSEIVKQIKEIIETHVRPAVANDGGDIVFHAFDEETGIVKLELHGACAGCPSSTITLKNGIENLLQHYVPEVQSVESV